MERQNIDIGKASLPRIDPDTTLAALRQWVSYDRTDDYLECQAKELFEALDTWLESGGYVPRQWRLKTSPGEWTD